MNTFTLLTSSYKEGLSNILNTCAIINEILSYDSKNVPNAMSDVLTTRHLLRSLNLKDELKIFIKIYQEEEKGFEVKVLINNGAMENFIYTNVVDEFHFSMIKLSKLIPMYNVDQTINLIGEVTH